jgi:serine/threonine protein kinase
MSQKYSSKSDVWSFAVTVIEMLRSAEPFDDLPPM